MFLRHFIQTARVAVLAAGCLLICGCSFGVMASRLIMGDPMIPARFNSMTGVNLQKSGKKILVVCTTSNAIEATNPSLQFDLADGVTHRLKREKVEVISSQQVLKWLDKHAGRFEDINELVGEFEADYIAWIELHHIGFNEENSPKLLRGRASGFINVFQVEEVGGARHARQVFTTEFSSTYPTHQPIAQQSRSSEVFEKEYIDRLCEEIGNNFYDHRPGMQF